MFQLDIANVPSGFLQKDIRHDNQHQSKLSKAKIWFIDGMF